MRRLLGVLVILGLVLVGYMVVKDPDKREKLLGTIESSTGVNLDASPSELAGQAGRAVGEATESVLQDLGELFRDPEFQRSLKKWGIRGWDSLDNDDLQRLKRDLRREADEFERDFDAVFEKYFGDLEVS
ncbi:MAG: hypothetical protein MI717_10495 [Spirochaetales bacterium]|nr:hypothetical protein [Spirochaetales bacterium]